MTLPTLPVPKVYVCFEPTASVGGVPQSVYTAANVPLTNAYWTDVTKYVKDGSTNSGRQHYLDRVEPATLRLTFLGNDGFFMNGAMNGSGNALTPLMPIAVVQSWVATTYPVFWGLIETITEKNADQLNSDLQVEAADLTKYLSQKRVNAPSFWKLYAASASVQSWYSCNNLRTVVVTSGTGNGTTITYQAQNTFQSGEKVTVAGLGGLATLNVANATISAVTASSFTVSVTGVTAVSSGSGVAYICAAYDNQGAFNGTYVGNVSYPLRGALIYVDDGCVDLANGTNKGSGYIELNAYASTMGALDFWMLGQQIAGARICNVTGLVGTTYYKCVLEVSGAGTLALNVPGVGITDTGVIVNDGYWHHVGVCSNSAGVLTIYADSGFHTISGVTFTGWSTALTASTTYNLTIGADSGTVALNAQIDEVVISTTANVATLETELLNRFRAGSMLQRGFPVTASKWLSGDRIAEILCLAGFGHINAGNVVIDSNTFYISNAYKTPVAYTNYAAGNGFCAVEPYYWDSPVTSMTALDLILQVVDTDIGAFFQSPDGNFHFFTQNYYGSWAFTPTNYSTLPPTPPSGTWTPAYTAPTGQNIWTDDNSSVYAYDGITLKVVRDDADIWTTVRVTPQAGVDQIYEDTAVENRWGYSTLVKSSTVSASLSDALSSAYYMGYLYRTPLPRVPAVELRGETALGTNYPAMLATSLGDVVHFDRTSPNAGTGSSPIFAGIISQDMIVESIAHTFNYDPGTYHVSFSLDPYPVRP